MSTQRDPRDGRFELPSRATIQLDQFLSLLPVWKDNSSITILTASSVRVSPNGEIQQCFSSEFAPGKADRSGLDWVTKKSVVKELENKTAGITVQCSFEAA